MNTNDTKTQNAPANESVTMPPERTYIPLNQAAAFLAERIWQPHNSSLALRRLKGDGWKINDLSEALHFMLASEVPKAREKIDALLAVSRLAAV